MDEQAPTLRVTGVDLNAYADQLIERYSNPALKHRTWQIAMDGSQKLPQRMLDSVRWHLQHGGAYRCLALGIAGWMRYVGGIDDNGQAIDIRDPMADSFKKCVASSEDGVARVQSLLSLKSLFGESLPQQQVFVDAVTEAYLSLQQFGAKESVKRLAQQD